MFTKTFTKAILIPLAILLAACGNVPSAVNQFGAPVVQNPSAGENTVTQTAASFGSSEAVSSVSSNLSYPIVDTNQTFCYSDSASITCPNKGQAYFGQDAQYTDNTPRYKDNGDGTVTDLVTSLMWQQDPGQKLTYDQAVAGASKLNLAGYTDWRLPTIKELYSLIEFSGTDASICMNGGTCNSKPFIDTNYFHFSYGNTSAGERIIDSQWATSSIYTGTVFNGQQAVFGVNFADGRIKGYPTGIGRSGQTKTFFVIYVRGNTSYGINKFVDNRNGTITDQATGLTWTQSDSGKGLNWRDALNYCAGLNTAGNSDWRLPNAKELQSIVDYSRSPDATNSAAIDPIFKVSTITNEAGQLDYPAYWSSTTHMSSNGNSQEAVYVTFGRAMGNMNGRWMDVHGAGAQRAEDKSGDPSQYPTGHGPQGDAVRIYNYVRCVSSGTQDNVKVGGAVDNTSVTQQGQPPAGKSRQGLQGQGQGQGQAVGQQGQMQGPQQNGLHQPPQAAISACSGLSQDTACTINTPQGTLTGTCQIPPQSASSQLTCVPAGGLQMGGQP